MKRHVEIFEQSLPGGGKLVILRGIFEKDTTTEEIHAYMDNCVSRCVNGHSYNSFMNENESFIEKDESYTCVRIVVFGLNELPFEPYKDCLAQ